MVGQLTHPFSSQLALVQKSPAPPHSHIPPPPKLQTTIMATPSDPSPAWPCTHTHTRPEWSDRNVHVGLWLFLLPTAFITYCPIALTVHFI